MQLPCVVIYKCWSNYGEKRGANYSRCIRLDGPAARCSGRPKLPRQFVPVRNFEPRLFVPMPGNMGRPAFTFINLYIFCNLQRIHDYVCIYFLIRKFVCLFGKLTKIENAGQRFDKIAASVPCVILYEREHLSSQFHIIKFICTIFHCTLTWTRVRT